MNQQKLSKSVRNIQLVKHDIALYLAELKQAKQDLEPTEYRQLEQLLLTD